MPQTTWKHRSDWMSDRQLQGWIEHLAEYLADAMAEARERGLLLGQPQQPTKGETDDGVQGEHV